MANNLPIRVYIYGIATVNELIDDYNGIMTLKRRKREIRTGTMGIHDKFKTR